MGGPDSPDAATVTTDAAPAGDAPVMLTCKPQQLTNLTSGHHNSGMDCMDGCHDHGFTLAGTLHQTLNGSPAFGSWVTVKDATGLSFELVSQNNGNFYTSQVIAFPITVVASACPDAKAMTASIAATDTGCNKVGCHASGSPQGGIYLK